MKAKGKIRLIVAASLVLPIGMLSLVSAWAAPRSEQLPSSVDIAGGPIGTSTYVLATGVGKIILDHTAMGATVKPMESIMKDTTVDRGEVDMGVTATNSSARAYKGEGEYSDYRRANLRMLFHLYVTPTVSLAVRADSGITRISQLKGKRVASGFPADEGARRQVEVGLRSAGLTWDDVVQVPVPGAVAALKAINEGRVDASFAMGPTTPKTVEIHKAIGLRALSLEPGPKLDKIFKELLPASRPVLGKAGKGILKEDTWLIWYPWAFTASSHLNDAAAYEIVKALWENYKELHPVHFFARGFSPKTMVSAPAIPYHQGAIRFYREKGVWTKEFENMQKELLKQ